MRDCVVAGSGWSGQRMERNRFWQSEQRVLHEAVCCGTIERISEPYIVWGTVFVQTKRHSLP